MIGLQPKQQKTVNVKLSEDLCKKLERHCRARSVPLQEYIEETLIERMVREQL